MSDVSVAVATTHNAADLRDEIAESLEQRGYSVDRGWYELRSVDAGDLIIFVLAWRVAGVIGDELLREAVRTSVDWFRRARSRGPTQAIFELPGDLPVEYWVGPHVPDDALDLIESDHAASAPGDSKHDADRKRWLTVDQMMG